METSDFAGYQQLNEADLSDQFPEPRFRLGLTVVNKTRLSRRLFHGWVGVKDFLEGTDSIEMNEQDLDWMDNWA
jgi:hypothetical protein